MSGISQRPPSPLADERGYESDTYNMESLQEHKRLKTSRNKHSRRSHSKHSSIDSVDSSDGQDWQLTQSLRALDSKYARSTAEDNKVSSSNRDSLLNRRNKREREAASCSAGQQSPSPEKSARSRRPVSPPYFLDKKREAERIRKKYGMTIRPKSPPPPSYSSEVGRTRKKYGMTTRRRPPSPPPPEPKREKIPYFADEVREKDRLRRKYQTPSPPSPAAVRRSSNHRVARSRSRRRRRSYSRSRSRSKSRQRRSSSGRHRSSAPKIITIPVPVPLDYFTTPPFASQHFWPRPPLPPNVPPLPPYQRQRQRNSFGRMPPMVPPPPVPSMCYMPRYAPPPPMGPYMGSRFRYPPYP